MITVTIEDPDQPAILAMLRAGEANSAALYPAESNHHLPLASLRAPGVLFHVARDAQGLALGTGAVVAHGDWGEIKRMWTDPAARGRGVARAVLEALEQAARDAGLRLLRLETGVHSHAALALYRRAGFVEIAAFEGYAPDPLSVFMEKTLAC
ncbi:MULTISPECIES: GNAT family N-acetyltransferase [Roseomonadaceae]|uniref:GNAT family N-acetyltransferase n=1 Tax=Falsiroseomonas oleicola TaxID=2801474 RepID=A0ABS6H304_9PROT|nr:GNAT family N-acetyltransferase [Roseomonas oleicola]MBU8543054.1 GNAT family N-acetyltransferase [Roseomonas oleicola]